MEKKPINRDNLKELGFMPLGLKRWSKTSPDTFVIIKTDISRKLPHTELECGNDSIHVPNCKSMDDINDLIRMFSTYNK